MWGPISKKLNNTGHLPVLHFSSETACLPIGWPPSRLKWFAILLCIVHITLPLLHPLRFSHRSHTTDMPVWLSVLYHYVISSDDFANLLYVHSEIAKHLALPPVKLHCSMLAEDAIKAAVKDYQTKRAAAASASQGGQSESAAVAAWENVHHHGSSSLYIQFPFYRS